MGPSHRDRRGEGNDFWREVFERGRGKVEGTGGRSHYDGIKEETTGLTVFHDCHD